MASWSIEAGNEITGATKMKEADNKLSLNIVDIKHWLNSTDGTAEDVRDWSGGGFEVDVLETRVDNVETDINAIETAALRNTIPIGMICAISSNITGTQSIPASGTVDSKGWMLCNGASIPAGQIASGTTPDLTDGRFLRGSTSSGAIGGGTITIAEENLPKHSHTVPNHIHSIPDHSHPTTTTEFGGIHNHSLYTESDGTGGNGSVSTGPHVYNNTSFKTANSSSHTHDVTVKAKTGLNTDDSGSVETLDGDGVSTPIVITPTYINTQYIIKVS